MKKNGAIVEATTAPEKPALQLHPAATFKPLLLTGQLAAVKYVEDIQLYKLACEKEIIPWQVELKKNGAIVEASTAPEKPALQAHPTITFIPVLFAGHCTTVERIILKMDHTDGSLKNKR